jgi:hypothetical protein
LQAFIFKWYIQMWLIVAANCNILSAVFIKLTAIIPMTDVDPFLVSHHEIILIVCQHLPLHKLQSGSAMRHNISSAEKTFNQRQTAFNDYLQGYLECLVDQVLQFLLIDNGDDAIFHVN